MSEKRLKWRRFVDGLRATRTLPVVFRFNRSGGVSRRVMDELPFWFRQDTPGVIFLMNVVSVEQAKTELDTLPLTAAKLMTFNLMPVGPLSPLGMP